MSLIYDRFKGFLFTRCEEGKQQINDHSPTIIMTSPILERLDLIKKQLLVLNEMIGKTIEYLPESCVDTFMNKMDDEISGVKFKLNVLHREINEVMKLCYGRSLDAVFIKSSVDSKFFVREDNNFKEKLTKLEKKSDII